MMALTEQIPVQQKIAELERRVEALEKQRGAGEFSATFMSSSKQTSMRNPVGGEHWREMWRHFDEMMKEVFSK